MSRSPWYREVVARPDARVRLIIVPHAGGGPAYFRSWGAGLPDWVEPVVVQLPGRASRWKEPPFTRIEPLLDALGPALGPLLDRPVFLFGHSLGAVIAFELARRWTAAGVALHGLAVGGAPAPRLPRTRRPLYRLPDRELRRELLHLGGTPAEVQSNDELFQLFVPTLRADLEVLETYRFTTTSPVAVPLLVSGGTCDGWAGVDDLLPWSEVSTAGTAFRLFPGGHFFFTECRAEFLRELGDFMAGTRAGASPLDIYRIDLDAPADDGLSAEESGRADRFLHERHRRRFVAGRSALRRILGERLGVRPQDVSLQTASAGKPFLSGCGVFFNVSHSDDAALVAVCGSGEVGVDIERHRPEMATGPLARRYFSACEVADLEALPEADRPARFFAYWSAKEAYIKARGLGLNIPLDGFDVPLNGGPGPFVVVDRYTPAESGRWLICPLHVADGLSAAVCVERPVSSIRLLAG